MLGEEVTRGWGAVRVRRRVAMLLAGFVATAVVVAGAAPRDAHAWAWKDVCAVVVHNETGTLSHLKPFGPLVEVPPNPADYAVWTTFGLPLAGIPESGMPLLTAGIPITWGCHMWPNFTWGGGLIPSHALNCRIAAPTKGANTFACSAPEPYVHLVITKNNADIVGAIYVYPPSASMPPPVSISTAPKRVPALLRRADLPGRRWRAANRLGQLGRLGRILLSAPVPRSCQDAAKSSEPTAKRGGASAFTRGAEMIGYMHGVYTNAQQSRRTLADAVSPHSIGCLARLLSSTRFHTRATFARYSLSDLKGVSLWRLVITTRSGNRITRTDYLDVAGLPHRQANALVMFANRNRPVSGAVEQSVIHTVARRLP